MKCFCFCLFEAPHSFQMTFQKVGMYAFVVFVIYYSSLAFREKSGHKIWYLYAKEQPL